MLMLKCFSCRWFGGEVSIATTVPYPFPRRPGVVISLETYVDFITVGHVCRKLGSLLDDYPRSLF